MGFFPQNGSRGGQLIARAALFLFFVFHNVAFAEHVELYGVDFTVESKRVTSPGFSMISIGGSTEILNDKLIPDFIAQKYFGDRDLYLSLSTKTAETFVRQSIEAGRLDLAALALKGLFEFGDATSPQALALFNELKESPHAVELFKLVVPELTSTSVSPRIISTIITTLGLSDISWVRANASRWLYLHVEDLRAYVRDVLYEKLKDQQIDDSERLVSLLSDVFGAEDREVKSFKTLIVKLRNLTSGASDENGSGVTLTDLAGDDPILKRYLAPVFLDTVHKQALAALKSNDAEKALRIVAQIDLEKRTPATHSLVSEALNALEGKNEMLLHSQRVEDFVITIAEKDSYVREAYLEAIQRMIEYRVSSGLVEEGKTCLTLITKIRPDPNSLNDEIRIKSAVELLRNNKLDKADLILADVRTSISPIKKLTILYFRIIHSPSVLAFLAFGILAIFTILFTILRRSMVRPPSKDVSSDLQEKEALYEDEEVERPAFVTARGGRSGGLPQEYLECLYEFGLGADASAKEIKTAFRNKVKDIHPDHSQNKKEDPEEFIRINAVYEKLLSIRKRMGYE